MDATYVPVKKSGKAKKSTCYCEGDADGFIIYVGAKFRNVVANVTRSRRCSTVWECCGSAKTLDAAHRHGNERLDIIRRILKAEYEIGPDFYRVELMDFEDKFKAAHLPLDDVFFFLCSACYTAYDGKNAAKSKAIEDAVIANRAAAAISAE